MPDRGLDERQSGRMCRTRSCLKHFIFDVTTLVWDWEVLRVWSRLEGLWVGSDPRKSGHMGVRVSTVTRGRGAQWRV